MTREKKKKSKVIELVRTGPKDRSFTDMKVFHRHAPWAEWWTEFCTEVGPDGFSRYQTLRQFVLEKRKNKLQSQFLYYYLGPKDVNDDKYKLMFPWVTPQDWQQKKETGGWFTEENLRMFEKELNRTHTALQAFRQGGKDFTLHTLNSLARFDRKLDQWFNGEPFVRGLTFEQNKQRGVAYLEFKRQVIEQLHSAWNLWAKSYGINFDQMQGFADIVRSLMEKEAGATAVVDPRQKLLNNVLYRMQGDMLVRDMETEGELKGKLKEIAAGAVIDVEAKKSNVQ